jgi:pimeloyl-ACP methyl ester carboxylesterase
MIRNKNMSTRLHRFVECVLIVIAATGLCGCLALPDPDQPIPTQRVPAQTDSPDRLVVVLPGRGDDLAMLNESRIAQEIQQVLPDTDVLLVEATMSYYMEGRLVPRLHTEVIAPALQRGYREIWLAGASMGGLGVLMYEHEHPNALTGLLLMAPYMGPTRLQKEIRAAGGLASWDPGPKPPTLTRDNVPREEWRVVKAWLTDKNRAKNVWLICGDEDRLVAAADIVATALPADHYFRPSGGHRWTVWSPAAGEVLGRAVRQGKSTKE